MNYKEGYFRSFHLEDFVAWCDEVGNNAPPLWTELRVESKKWDVDVVNTIFGVLDVITFPIRYAYHIVTSVIDFFETFVFYNNYNYDDQLIDWSPDNI